jgi:aminoglycoside phosphotransferase (APT) family kinase protein
MTHPSAPDTPFDSPSDAPFEAQFEAARLAGWLGAALDAPVASLTATRLAGGHSGGAWRIDVELPGGVRRLVLKAPGTDTLVFGRDVDREARILAAGHEAGAPLPAVVAIDSDGSALGLPCFVMDLVAGRSLGDTPPAGCHGEGWLRDAGPAVQRCVWNSFHDALAAVHAIEPATVPEAALGPNGIVDYVAYWRSSLLDVAPVAAVPRHLAALDWLAANLPADADEAPALCMADARLGNAVVEGDEVRALVDFEVAYLGNPAADIGYSLFFDAMQRGYSGDPLPGFSDPETTWARWEHVTGRRSGDRPYWTAFAAAVLCVTAARAMVQWGADPSSIEAAPGVLAAWERAVDRAAG